CPADHPPKLFSKFWPAFSPVLQYIYERRMPPHKSLPITNTTAANTTFNVSAHQQMLVSLNHRLPTSSLTLTANAPQKSSSKMLAVSISAELRISASKLWTSNLGLWTSIPTHLERTANSPPNPNSSNPIHLQPSPDPVVMKKLQ